MSGKAWLDVSIFRCPSCSRWYSDVSWYAVEMESDIECGTCHTSFNAKEKLTDRAIIEFEIDEEDRIFSTKIAKHIETGSSSRAEE